LFAGLIAVAVARQQETRLPVEVEPAPSLDEEIPAEVGATR
jgi:hypothetical protein